MYTKQDFLKIYNKEFKTTLKVMRAFPEDKIEFKPHERSSDAKKLITTFVFEMFLLDGYIFGGKTDPARFKSYSPKDLKTLISDFEKESVNIIAKLKEIPDLTLSKTLEFAGTKFTADEFMLMMLFDQIHHRGQLTVYIRLAGGKVPSVYGPSADDPSTNL